VLEAYQIGAVVGGKLRWTKSDEARITREDSAIVVPLAQSQTIDMFYRGIDPQLDEKLDEIAVRCAGHLVAKNGAKSTSAAVETMKRAFRKALEDEIDGNYREPLMAAVNALPRYELARMAETLVSLTVVRKRMSVDQKETVGGAIDVALLSKGEGFVWIKRGGAGQRQLPDVANRHRQGTY
jgi:SpoVK/Ycf46/Vps4 family AAA+-type ATPase